MTDGHEQAILLAIQKKLNEADLRIIEARKIFTNYVKLKEKGQPTPIRATLTSPVSKRRAGLFPGQYDNHIDQEEDNQPDEICDT